MPALIMTKTDPAKNMARFYKLDVQPTLFGEWALVKEWGRIGRGGTVREEPYETRGTADRALVAAFERRIKRGYR